MWHVGNSCRATEWAVCTHVGTVSKPLRCHCYGSYMYFTSPWAMEPAKGEASVCEIEDWLSLETTNRVKEVQSGTSDKGPSEIGTTFQQRILDYLTSEIHRDDLSTGNKIVGPIVSPVQRFHCSWLPRVHCSMHSRHGLCRQLHGACLECLCALLLPQQEVLGRWNIIHNARNTVKLRGE